jgi:hypothetical protein
MPLPNRVTPLGTIEADPARGTMMGNRGGCMHDANRRIVRQWVNRRWICCVLEFRGRHREVMQPGRYTELFFLDEATAFAAGHRPCAECRRGDHLRFKEAWLAGNPGTGLSLGCSIDLVDDVLHRERLRPREPLAPSRLAALPPGVFVAETGDGPPMLWTGTKLLRWSHSGYGPASLSAGALLLVTPLSVANAFRAGYVPAIHASALD